MPDLRISYINQYGAARFLEYRTIMDFIEVFEQNIFDAENTMVQAVFFDKKINLKTFSTLQELYDFCIEITK